MLNYVEIRKYLLYLVLVIFICGELILGYNLPAHSYEYRCSSKLESALEHMLKKSQSRSGLRTHFDLSPYSLKKPLSASTKSYDTKRGKVDEKLDYNDEDYGDDERIQHDHPFRNSVEVAELRVRLPSSNVRWVHVDKCNFLAQNRTLSTRLVFPDLTISGKVLIQPSHEQCLMILRLRRAGIEFRTTPIVEERSRRTATIRTDSHFSEPGFISVYAHGCRSTRSSKYRPNSKRKIFNDRSDHYGDDDFEEDYERLFRKERAQKQYFGDSIYDNRRHHYRKKRATFDDILHSSDDDIHFNDDLFDSTTLPQRQEHSRTLFSDYFANRYHHNNKHQADNQWQNIELTPNADEIDDELARELEDLFSNGVRSLLTTYMQKALQPAIKETLMESMGYTLSYG